MFKNLALKQFNNAQMSLCDSVFELFSRLYNKLDVAIINKGETAVYLKSIEVQGFKSFADKTTLDFGEGVTAVVGPNGSGKSNIADAIRWVMGEVSAKSLRGSNMQDVIFAGTSARNAMNHAQVSLVLDNSENRFDIDYQQVKVTRRLYRSGDSEYLINGSPCRLKDIHELFMDTGVGRDGYSVIGQGQIAEILSAKPDERRHLFEEAAGISKYRYRKQESERKLKNTEENLVRITDIVSELESQLQPLAVQSEKAREFVKLHDEMKTLDVNLAINTIDKSKEATAQTESEYQMAKQELEQAKEAESQTQKQLSDIYEAIRAKDAQTETERAELDALQNSIKQELAQVSLYQNTIENNLNLIKRINNEIDSIRKKTLDVSSEEALLKEQIDALTLEKQKLQEEHKQLETEAEEKALSAKRSAKLIDDLKAKSAQNNNQIASGQARLQGIDALRQNQINRRMSIEQEIEADKNGREYSARLLNDTKSEIETKKRSLDQLTQRYNALDNNVKQLTDEYNALINEANAKTVELNSKKSKYHMLEDMENNLEGYAKSVKSVLKAQELKKYQIYGTLSQIVQVQQKYVIAVETVLAGALQNIVVQSENDAKAAIEYLKRNNGGRATFLPVTAVKGRNFDELDDVRREKGYLCVGSDAVSCAKTYDGIVSSLLGRVVIADNIDNAIAISRKFGYKFRVVTLEGELLSPGGAMSGGSVSRNAGFLSRANEIRSLQQEIDKLKILLSGITKKAEAKSKEKEELLLQLQNQTSLIDDFKQSVVALSLKAENLEKTLAESGDVHENLSKELEQIAKSMKQLDDEMLEVINTLSTLQTENETLDGQIAEKTKAMATLDAERQTASERLVEAVMNVGKTESDILLCMQKLDDNKRQISEFSQSVESKTDECVKIEQENKDIEQKIAESQKIALEINASIEQKKQYISKLSEDKTALQSRQLKIQESTNEMRDELLNLQQNLLKAEAKKQKIETELENIINRLWEDYELTYSTALELKTDIGNLTDAAKRVNSLKNQIKRLGNVNLGAMEEYKNVKERYDFLSEQKDDLEHAKTDLNKIIKKLQDTMEIQFREQVEIINKCFTKVFAELFGGGKGRLYLTDTENVLESGIEIEAQLPGKNLQNINLYSGGEKSIIAIALLLSIIKVNPTPFCLLDEIDAALDDVNVSRYATYIKYNYTNTQFVIITHRRGTMEIANMLYGVTMQEKGVSSLISLNIDEIEKHMK